MPEETEVFLPGTRVRHYGDQYTKAYVDGTATIMDSTTVNGHLEYLVDRDKARFPGDSRSSWWAAERTFKVKDGYRNAEQR